MYSHWTLRTNLLNTLILADVYEFENLVVQSALRCYRATNSADGSYWSKSSIDQIEIRAVRCRLQPCKEPALLDTLS